MSFISKTRTFFSSYEFFIYLLAVTVLGSGVLIFVYKLSLWGVANLLPVKVFLVLMMLNRVFGLVAEIRVRSLNAFLSAGILLIALGFIADYAFRFDGRAGLGEGEAFIEFESIDRGPLAAVPRMNIAIEKIEGDPLKPEKRPKVTITGDRKVKVLKAETAPRFVIWDASGKELNTGFVKLNLNPPGSEDMFRSPVAPHRFYLTLRGKDEKPLHLKIVREKLTIVEKDISPSEEVEFDGLKISFPEFRQWAEIQVRSYPGTLFILAGCALGIVRIGYSLKRWKGK